VRFRLDCQFSPATARWTATSFACECEAPVLTPFLRADDRAIFASAARAGAIIISKDSDFAELVTLQGPPPPIILITVGNTSDAALREVLNSTPGKAPELIAAGEPLVEIGS
jgi:predicted nuclease of predicted toxin-antitoxin system